MKKIFYKIFQLSLLALFILFKGCTEETTPGLPEIFPPATGAAPVVNSVDPANSALAGVSVVTLNGSDFSTDKSQMVVYFNDVPANILEATPTQVKVQAPNLPSDSVAIRVSKIGAEKFSNTVQYQLTPAYAEVKKDQNGVNLFTENLIPYGLTTDAQGNLYTSVVEFSVGIGIKKITPAGVLIPAGPLEDFAPKGGETSFNRLNMWQNNTIIGSRRVAAVFEITQGVAAKVFVSQGLTQAYDIDFDQNLNIWVGGRGLFRLTPAKELKSFSYPDVIKSVRVYNNHLYILTTVNGDDIVRRYPILSSDSLGTAEDLFNIAQSVLPDSGTTKVEGNDFDIAADGDIVIGTTRNTDPIIVLHQDGTFDPLYPGVIPAGTRVYAFAWDPGQYLYFTREASGNMIQTIFRVDMQKQGAPHYGR